jgi:imidazolonepropionase-like amidohydrolase
VTLADAKELVRAGVEGWTHVPVRGGDVVDDEILALVKARVATNHRPTAAGSPPRTPARRGAMWMTTGLRAAWANTQGAKPAWLDDPLLHDTYPRQQNEEHLAGELARLTPAEVENARRTLERDGRNAMRLREAGIRIVLGTDTGQIRHRIGYFAHLELEALVAIGMTPAEAIVAATRDAAQIAEVNTGMVASGRSADFIVLDANPLDRISNTRRIAEVYLRGQRVDRAALRARWRSTT